MKLLIVNTDVLIVIKRSLLFLFMMLMLINCSRVVLEGDRENRNIRITDPYKGTVTIRFQFINNLVVIPARVNNSPELKFILDTGAGRTIITELGADQSFEIEYEENILLNGLGKGEPLSALISRAENYHYSSAAANDKDSSNWDNQALLKRLVKIRKRSEAQVKEVLPSFYP